MPYTKDGLPFVEGSETSEDAAKKAKKRAEVDAIRIYEFIGASEGSTCEECEDALDLKHQTASARIRGLVQDAFLKDSGEKRLTKSGRKAIVWVRV